MAAAAVMDHVVLETGMKTGLEGAEQISGMVGWYHSSTRKEPREVTARVLGTTGDQEVWSFG